MQFPIINQQDSRWANTELGTGQGYTIGKYGCALSCITAIASWYGRNTTPDQLNLALFQVSGFQSNGTINSDGSINKTLLVWGMLAAVYGEIRLERNIAYPTTPCDMSIVDAYLTHNQPVIVGVSFTHDPKQTVPSHYVVIYKKNTDGTYMCMDPWYGDEVVFESRYAVNKMTASQAILQLVCYAGPAPVEQATEAPITAHPQQAVTADDTLKKQVEDNWNLYLQEVDLAKQKDDRIQELEQTVQQLKNDNKSLSDEIANTKELNSTLATHLSNLEKSDSAAVKIGQAAQDQLEQQKEIVATTAQILKTKPTLKGILSEIDSTLSQLNFLRRQQEKPQLVVTPAPQASWQSMFGMEVKQ